MPDKFQYNADSPTAPGRRAVAVVPHDVNALADTPKVLYVGTGGNVTLRGVDDTADTVFKNVPSGAFLPIRAQFVRATGTNAADIVALL